MKKTVLKVEDVFGDVISKGIVSPEKITELNKIPAKLLRI